MFFICSLAKMSSFSVLQTEVVSPNACSYLDTTALAVFTKTVTLFSPERSPSALVQGVTDSKVCLRPSR